MTFHVVLASPNGGTGRTTIVAQLAAALGSSGTRCLAIDLDPQNTLGLMLSGSPNSWITSGGASGSLCLLDRDVGASALAASLRSRRAQIPYVPFGARDPERRRALKSELMARPEALREQLSALTPSSCELLLIDTPSGSNPWSDAALRLADLIIVPLRADPTCLASLPGYESYLSAIDAKAYPESVHYVINQLDPTRQLSADIADALASCVQGHVLARPIHEDEAVREQLALGTPLDLTPGMQANHDFRWLAQHVQSELAKRHPLANTAAHAS